MGSTTDGPGPRQRQSTLVGVAMAQARTFTWSDIQRLPEDGLRRELVGGELLATPAPGEGHQAAVGGLYQVLVATCPPSYRVLFAPFDWYLAEDTYFEPDITVIPRKVQMVARFEGTPLLVVEVLSPSTRAVDTVLKRDAYAAAGAPHYWIVDPDEASIEALALQGGKYVERAAAAGEERFAVTEPFALQAVPARLLD